MLCNAIRSELNMHLFKPQCILRLQTDGGQVGLAHGVGAKEMISRSVAFYQKMFLHTCKMDWETVRSISRDWQGEIEQKWPKYHSEMKGNLNDLTSILSLPATN